ncbi:MAG: hypothetical protein IPO36_09730 [Anaerolineales bacterium]|nr:hypothetical protein [Anaerolineales bacterium]
MLKDALKDLEDVFPKIVKLMPDEFNSHDFILALARKYQKLYVQALFANKEENLPFNRTHMAIGKRLKRHKDLVKQIDYKPSPNIFGQENKVAVWQKVKK